MPGIEYCLRWKLISGSIQAEVCCIETCAGGPRWYPTHRVRIEADSHLYRIVRQELIEVNSIHHQAIKEVSPCFKVAAYSADGVIEAIEKKEGAFVLGVQWHPECLWQDSKENFNIFKEFIEQCRE